MGGGYNNQLDHRQSPIINLVVIVVGIVTLHAAQDLLNPLPPLVGAMTEYDKHLGALLS